MTEEMKKSMNEKIVSFKKCSCQEMTAEEKKLRFKNLDAVDFL